MNARLLAVTLVLLLTGFLALMALQWKLGAESFSVRSPQEVVVPLGGRKIVGGGRAGVELIRRIGEKAEVKVRCGAGERWLKLEIDRTSDEVCSVRLRLRSFSTESGTLATSRAHLEVTWDPPAGGDTEPKT